MFKVAVVNDISYEEFMSLKPAIFYIIVEEKAKHFNSMIELMDMYFGQVCATIASTSTGKKYKYTDFFKRNDKALKDKTEIKIQSVDEMAAILESLCV